MQMMLADYFMVRKLDYPLTSRVLLHTNQGFRFVVLLPWLDDFGYVWSS